MRSSYGLSATRQPSTRDSSRVKTSTDAEGGKSISPYNPQFEMIHAEANIFHPNHPLKNHAVAPEPENWDFINQELSKRRPSLTIDDSSREQHTEFIRAEDNALNETTVRQQVEPLLQGTLKGVRCRSSEIRFSNMEPLIKDKNLK